MERSSDLFITGLMINIPVLKFDNDIPFPF